MSARILDGKALAVTVTDEVRAAVAARVARVDLPFEMAESGGKDVRDLLQQPDGETTLRKLIEEAVAAASTKEQDASGPEGPITNGAEMK